MTEPTRYPDGMPMYCPICLVELPTHHKHVKKNNKEALEILCPSEHFVTRFIPDPLSETGWKLDLSAYGHKR